VHHSLFVKLVGFSVPLVVANFVWMASIAFLPFPTELVAPTGLDSTFSSALYVATMCVTTASTTAITWIAIRNPALQAAEERGRMTLHAGVASTITMFVVLAVVILLPQVGLWALLLLFPAGFIGDRLGRRSLSASN